MDDYRRNEGTTGAAKFIRILNADLFVRVVAMITVEYMDIMEQRKGLVRSEGKEYVVQDGDVVLFRFNV
ncbi:MAG: DUF933 domain-containing protein [Clostridium sp.]